MASSPATDALPATGVPMAREGAAARAVALARRWGPLAAVLLLAAFLYTWKLDQNGWGNTYYAASAQSMTRSWSNFFFGAFDPEGIVTVDKPPLSQWVIAASVGLFGLNSWSLLLPQAVLGVACVAMLYSMVRPHWGEVAAIAAAFVLATTPITVAIVRINNPDTLLVFLMLAGGRASMRATERGSLRWGIVAALCIGLAFNVKMLQAFLVVPAMALAYLVAAKGSLWRRAWTLAVAGLVLAAVSASWMVVVDAWPSDSRPYIGGSKDNSVFDLAFGYNGLDRIEGQDPAGPAAAAQNPQNGPDQPGGAAQPQQLAPARSPAPNFGGDPGWLRLFQDQSGPLIGWLLPFAGTILVLGIDWRGKAPRTDMRRAWLLFWGGWGLVHVVVFSTQEGIYHPYYTSALAPAVAALTGIGGALALTWLREGGWRRLLALAAGAGYTVAVQVFITRQRADWNPWMVPAAGAALALGIGLVALSLWLRRRPRRWLFAGYGGMAAAFGGLLLMPFCWGLTPLDGPRTSPDVAVGPQHPRVAITAAQQPRPNTDLGPNQRLVDYLLANYGGERFLAAAFGSQSASPLMLHTGENVLPIGGFSGNDPVPTLDELRRMIDSGEIAFALLTGTGPGGRGDRQTLIARTCKLVPAVEYGGIPNVGPPAAQQPGQQPPGPQGPPPDQQPRTQPPAQAPRATPAPPQGLYDCRQGE